jgi:hypothetical protein
MKTSQKITAGLLGLIGVAGGAAATIALQTHAATTTPSATTIQDKGGFRHGTPPAAAGSVTAVNGNTITVTDKRSGTSFTVDAGSATIEKITPPVQGSTPPTTPPSPTTIKASDIVVGDNVSVEGTVSGSTITATKIVDGMFMGMMGRGGFKGHGPQGAFGTVSAVSGNTITLTGKDGKTYTVDATSSTVKKVSDSNVSSISVGATLMVNGTLSGTNITAQGIVDGELGPKQ